MDHPAFLSPVDEGQSSVVHGLNRDGSKMKSPPAVRRRFKVVPHEPGTIDALSRLVQMARNGKTPVTTDALSRLILMAHIGDSPGTLKEKPKTLEEREKYCRDRLRGRVALDPSVLEEESGDFYDPLEENGAPKFCNIKKNRVV
ncbi:hypothetical protein ABKV19_010847 [Rosa sericea]